MIDLKNCLNINIFHFYILITQFNILNGSSKEQIFIFYYGCGGVLIWHIPIKLCTNDYTPTEMHSLTFLRQL